MHDGWRIAALVLSTVGYLFAFLLIPRIILERRQPAATVAWVLSIALLPVLGVPIYFLVGGRRIRRHIRAKIGSMGSVESSVENRIRAEDLPNSVAVDCGRVLSAAGAPPPVVGNRVTVVGGGEEAYQILLELIEEARDHIHAQFFILDVDAIGKRFIHALSARARAGIKVRLLLDAVGSWRALRRLVRPLRQAGGEVAEFLPALPLHRKWSAHLRNHRKLLVVDGRTAFTGGMNIGKRYMGPRPDPARWRDSAIVIDGAAVRDLQALFLDDWAFATDEAGPSGRLFPSIAPVAGTGKRTAPLQVVASGPDRALRPIYQGVFTAITSARRRIWLATPYFVPDDAIGTSLKNAALRGVDVKVIVPERSDLKMVWLAGRSYFDELMVTGVNIHLFSPTHLHSKVMIIDDAVGMVGSSNVDIRSFFLNFEMGVFLYGKEEIDALGAAFAKDLSQSRQLDAKAFARRPKSIRFLEDTCRIFSPLF
ncbi:MAG TPA: cardiolipin synthase [Candidatus Deferrimicrobiaceae bacterium]|nr:cardiolipin synthase [Candidatus Deferrimicrobiaceae bacterium]